MTSHFYNDLIKSIEHYNSGHEPVESSILKICKIPLERPGLIVPGLMVIGLLLSLGYIAYFGVG
jgi:hypothetical protein